MRIASESLTHYDAGGRHLPRSYGPPVPAVTSTTPSAACSCASSRAAARWSASRSPSFKAWHADHADDDGEFEVDLPSIWPLGPDEAPPAQEDPEA